MGEKVRYYQVYVLHLINGETLEVAEPYYDMSKDKGLIPQFKAAKPNELFVIGDELLGFSYVPKKSIVYISEEKIIER